MTYHIKFYTAGDDFEALMPRTEAVLWLTLIKWSGTSEIGLGNTNLRDLSVEDLAIALSAGTAAWLETRTDRYIRVFCPTVDEAGEAIVKVDAIVAVRIWWDEEGSDDGDNEDDEPLDQELLEFEDLPPDEVRFKLRDRRFSIN